MQMWIYEKMYQFHETSVQQKNVHDDFMKSDMYEGLSIALCKFNVCEIRWGIEG